MRKLVLSFSLAVLCAIGASAQTPLRTTLFNETMGNVSTTTSIAVHEVTDKFDMDAFTYSGTTDIRFVSTINSNGYTGASGLAHLFVSNIIGKDFTISGVNTAPANMLDLRLSYGVLKSNTFSNGSELVVEYSTNGTTWTALTFNPLTTGANSNVWQYRRSTSALPNSPTLKIRFRQTATSVQFRVDDIKVDYQRECVDPIVYAMGATTFCQGGSVLLDGTYLDANSYQWKKDGTDIPGATGATYTATTSGSYTVFVVSSILTTNDCQRTSAPVAVTVNSNPFVSISGGGQSFCQNVSKQLTANATGGNGAYGYNWTPGNVTTQTFTVPSSTLGTTTYTVTVTDANSCSASASANVTVNAVPAQPGVTPNGIQAFCEGGNAVLSSSVASGNQWYKNGIAITGETNQTYNAQHDGNYSVSTTVNGCESSRSTEVTVNEVIVQKASITLQTGTATACQGDNVALASSFANSNQWYVGGSLISGAVAQTYSVPTSTVGTFKYTVLRTATEDGQTCTAMSDTFTVVIKAKPAAPTVTNDSGDDTPCLNDLVTLSIDEVADSYSWTLNGGSPFSTSQVITVPTSSAVALNYAATMTINGCTSNPTFKTITVQPLPTVNISTNGATTFCQGGSVTLTANASNVSFAWDDDATTATAALAVSNLGSQGATGTRTYTVTVTDNAEGCVNTASQSVTINHTPTATISGVDTTLCSAAGTITLTASTNAGGTPTYQWNKNGSPISGQTASTLVLTKTTASTGNYTVTITEGSCAATSATRVVTVNQTPSVSITPSGATTFCQGQSVTLTASSTGATFVWNDDAASTTAAISVANHGSQGATGTRAYMVTATSNGCSNTASQSVTINHTPSATVAPTAVTICSDVATTDLVASTDAIATPSYQWSKNGAALTGETSNTLELANQVASSGNYVVTVIEGSCATNSAIVPVLVNQTPEVSNQTATICSAGTFNVSPSGVPAGTTYTWSAPAGSGFTGGAAGTSQTSIGGTLTNSGISAVTATYTVTPTSGAGCIGADFTVTVTVNPVPAINNQTAATCSGVAFTVTPTGVPIGTTYAWVAPAGSGFTGGVSANGVSSVSGTLTNTTFADVTATYTVTPTSGACTGADFTVTVTIHPTPTVAAVSNQMVCNGSAVAAVNFTGDVTGTTFAWTNNNVSIGLAGSGNGDIATFNGVNSGNTIQTANITVTPSANGCTGTATTFNIVVNPTPNVNSVSNSTVCNGTNMAATTLSGTVSGTVYNWTNNNINIGLAASGTGDVPAFIATNSTTGIISGTVTVTTTANGCVGTGTSYTVTVNPTPEVDQPSSQVLCNNTSTAAVTFTNASFPVAGTTYAWTNTNNTIGLAASGNGNIAAFTATNSGSTLQVATVTVTPTANACPGNAKTFTYTVHPTPQFTSQPANATQCVGGTKSVSVTHTPGKVSGPTYQWISSPTGTAGTYTAVTGATSATYTPPNTTPGTTHYRCVVTTSDCTPTVDTSADATFQIVADPVATAPSFTPIIVSGTIAPTGSSTATFNAPTGGIGTPTYQWRYNGANVVNGTPAGLSYGATGTARQLVVNATWASTTAPATGAVAYTVIVTYPNPNGEGCNLASDPSGNLVVTNLGALKPGMGSNAELQEVKVYPNPFNNELIINVDQVQDGMVKVIITDMLGREINSFENFLAAGANQLQWNAADRAGNIVAEGSYIVRVQSENDVKTFTVIKKN